MERLFLRLEKRQIKDEKIRLLFEDQAQLALKTAAQTANIEAINKNHLAEADNKAQLRSVQATAEAKAIITKAIVDPIVKTILSLSLRWCRYVCSWTALPCF